MLFLFTENNNFRMGKTACKKKKFKDDEHPKYVCKKCGARVKKESGVCKSKKIKS